RRPKAQDLAETYHMALTVLLRLLFIAFAEERGLLARRTLRTMARELARIYPHGLPHGDSPFGTGTGRWHDVTTLFDSVRAHHPVSLFAIDADAAPVGAMLAKLSLPDTVMGPVLWHLLVTESGDGHAPIAFAA